MVGGFFVVMIVVTLAAPAVPALAQVLPPFDTSRIYKTEAEFSRAIEPYRQAIAADARRARAHYWLGFAHLFAYRQWRMGAAPYAGEYLPRAAGPLEEAIKIDPAMVEAYLALHDVYMLMGEDAKASEVMTQMLQRTRPGWLPVMPGR
jgi:Tfp pilus assembly protein PilF